VASELSPSDQGELLRAIVRQWSEPLLGIEISPDVCGGEPRVVRTRIPVWVLEQARRLGLSESDILRAYPTLRAAILVNAWAFVQQHRQAIDQQIAENEQAE
jgi:uncharacterized protein (DUF433 family)